MMGNNKKLLLKGAAWIASARILISLVGFVSTIILARLLFPEDFGIMAVAGAAAGIVAAVTELSLVNALIQHDEPEDHHFDTAWTINILRAAFVALILVGLSAPVAAAYEDPRLGPVMLALAGGTIVGGLESPKLVTLQRKLIFWHEFALSVGAKLASFGVAIALAFAFQSYWALVAGGIAAQAARAIMSYLLVPYRPRFCLIGYKELISFSFWLTLGQAVHTINQRCVPLAIGFFLNSTTLGYYSMGGKLARLPVEESLKPVRYTLFPAFSRMKHDIHRLRAAYLRSQRILCSLAFPLSAGFAVLAEPAVRLLIGDKWLPAVPIIQVLTIMVAFQAIEGTTPIAMALGRTKALFGRDLRAFLVRIPLLIAGALLGQETPAGMLMGTIYGLFVASAINVLWNMQLVRDAIGLSITKQAMVGFRPAVASAIMMAAVAFVRKELTLPVLDLYHVTMLFALIGMGGLIYIAALFALWFVDGRPEGPESEVLQIARRLAPKIV